MQLRSLTRVLPVSVIIMAVALPFLSTPLAPAGLGAGGVAVAETAKAKAKSAAEKNAVDRARARARARARSYDRRVKPIFPKKRKWVIQGSMERATLFHINRVRKARGLRPVRGSRKLRRPARAHSRFLAVKHNGRLFHEDGRGRPFYVRLVAAGWPRNRRMSENLASITACRKKDPRIMVGQWLRSPGHRVNLLDPKVRYVGVGVISTRYCDVTVYTTDFGA